MNFFVDILQEKYGEKLLLCSRDIQTGDTVFYEDGTEVENLPENYVSSAKGGWAFKVIGEISSGATWVKVGDVLTEKEVYKELVCVAPEGYCWKCQRSKRCDSEDYIYKIKCPTCNNFH